MCHRNKTNKSARHLALLGADRGRDVRRAALDHVVVHDRALGLRAVLSGLEARGAALEEPSLVAAPERHAPDERLDPRRAGVLPPLRLARVPTAAAGLQPRKLRSVF